MRRPPQPRRARLSAVLSGCLWDLLISTGPGNRLSVCTLPPPPTLALAEGCAGPAGSHAAAVAMAVAGDRLPSRPCLPRSRQHRRRRPCSVGGRQRAERSSAIGPSATVQRGATPRATSRRRRGSATPRCHRRPDEPFRPLGCPGRPCGGGRPARAVTVAQVLCGLAPQAPPFGRTAVAFRFAPEWSPAAPPRPIQG